MIAEKVIGNLEDIKVDVPVDFVELDWFESEKKRIRKIADSGTEIGIAIDTNLKNNDILYLDDKICVAVKLTSCELLKISVSSVEEMGRLCFEIGNRHLSLKIAHDNVLIPYDQPTEQHLRNLHFNCEKVIDRFDDFIVCKAHGNSSLHHHHHEH